MAHPDQGEIASPETPHTQKKDSDLPASPGRRQWLGNMAGTSAKIAAGAAAYAIGQDIKNHRKADATALAAPFTTTEAFKRIDSIDPDDLPNVLKTIVAGIKDPRDREYALDAIYAATQPGIILVPQGGGSACPPDSDGPPPSGTTQKGKAKVAPPTRA